MPTMGYAGSLYVFQGDAVSGMVCTHGPAEKGIAVKNPDLTHIAGIVTNHHGLADIGCECRIKVSQSFETNAVPMNCAGPSNHDQ